MSWIFRVCPQGNAMTLHLTGPESHVFRILPGPGFCMRFFIGAGHERVMSGQMYSMDATVMS